MDSWIKNIDRSWTLFLDRDGVINVEKEDDYIRTWSEFTFIEGALESFPVFARAFGRIFIVTNQKGVGKGLMSAENLREINGGIIQAIQEAGGRIDKIYCCTAVDNNDPCRKPNPGMALTAKKEYPDIDFKRSLMIGNTLGDMRFGRSCGMYTIFIPSQKPMPDIPNSLIDGVFPGLAAVAKAL
jgi:D-glycero-D-manno-heptose 1,7-bisphosphate phosphatase